MPASPNDNLEKSRHPTDALERFWSSTRDDLLRFERLFILVIIFAMISSLFSILLNTGAVSLARFTFDFANLEIHDFIFIRLAVYFISLSSSFFAFFLFIAIWRRGECVKFLAEDLDYPPAKIEIEFREWCNTKLAALSWFYAFSYWTIAIPVFALLFLLPTLTIFYSFLRFLKLS